MRAVVHVGDVLEATPGEYVEAMTRVFHEVRRVLRPDGTLWLNLGDSYAGSRCGQGDTSTDNRSNTASRRRDDETMPRCDVRVPGLKPKDLCGIPWRVAFALQEDGWYLRSDIIWAKPNPMPESITDRPTKAQEYLFLLAKSRRYHYDAAAIREPAEFIGPNGPGRKGSPPEQNFHRIAGRNKRAGGVPSGWDTSDGGHLGLTGRYPKKYDREYERLTRNKRSVWTVPTQPFAEAHFATFPELLVEPCILAGCPEGGTVLDPFCGSGTTGVVACRLGRNFVGVELNPGYAAMAERRIAPHRDQLHLEEVRPMSTAPASAGE